MSESVERSSLDLRYRIVQRQTLERIAWFCMSQADPRLPYVDVDERFRQRPAYQEGCLTDEPDLRRYDLEDESDPEAMNPEEGEPADG